MSLYLGPIVHSLSATELQAIPSALIAVSITGSIEWIEHPVSHHDMARVALLHNWNVNDQAMKITRARPGEWFMPGLIDTHTVSSYSVVQARLALNSATCHSMLHNFQI